MNYFAVFILSLRVTKNDVFSSKFLFMKFLQRGLDLPFTIHFCFVTFFPGALVHTLVVIGPKPILRTQLSQHKYQNQRPLQVPALSRGPRCTASPPESGPPTGTSSCGYTAVLKQRSILCPFPETRLPENTLTKRKQQGREKWPKHSQHLNKH